MRPPGRRSRRRTPARRGPGARSPGSRTTSAARRAATGRDTSRAPSRSFDLRDVPVAGGVALHVEDPVPAAVLVGRPRRGRVAGHVQVVDVDLFVAWGPVAPFGLAASRVGLRTGVVPGEKIEGDLVGVATLVGLLEAVDDIGHARLLAR